MKVYVNISFLLLLLFPVSSFSISNAQLSEKDYRYTLTLIRELNIMVQNFGTDEEIDEYETIRRNFQRAAERHHARDFITMTSISHPGRVIDTSTTSLDLFYELKRQLIDMYETMTAFYINRTADILDSTSTEATEILIEYGKGSGLSKYFFARPIDPLNDNKPYDTDKYHYFRARETIEDYVDSGYRYLEEARNLYKDPDYQYILSKDVKTTRELTYILEKHRSAIAVCRKAKKCGIAIYQILNRHDHDGSLRKYDVNDQTSKRYPIYDDRIPEKYKVDATDNNQLIWAIEKRKIGNYEELNPNSDAETDPNTQRQEMNNRGQNNENDTPQEEDNQQADE